MDAKIADFISKVPASQLERVHSKDLQQVFLWDETLYEVQNKKKTTFFYLVFVLQKLPRNVHKTNVETTGST